jgi:tetratricopeptide (TPR) repeat protein
MARSLTPDSPLLAAIEARLLFTLGRLRESEASARESLALSAVAPTVAPQIPALARLRLSLTMYYTYRPREALDLVRPLLGDASALPQDSRETAQALQNRLVSDLSGGAHAERSPGGPKLVSAAPVPHDAEAAAAVQEIRNGLWDKAAVALASASARSADDVVIRYHLARAYEAAGKLPEARATLEAILRDTTKVPRTLHGWALIRLGSAMQQTGDQLGAAEQFRKAAALRGFIFSRAAEDRLRHLSDPARPEG